MTALTPYPSYRKTDLPWLGQIPAHWNVKRLKNALSRNDGGVWGDDSAIYEDGTIVLRSTDVALDGSWKITDPARRKLSATEFQAGRLLVGDLLVTKSSGSALHLGKTALVTKEIADLNCCFSNFMQRLRANSDFSPEYIYWIMNSIIGREQLNYFGSTTTGLNNLTGTLMGKLFIAAPPLPEQQAIAAFLDHQTTKIDTLIAKKGRLLVLLAEQRAALISKAVTKGMDPAVKMKDSGVAWLGQVPSHWEVKRLSATSPLLRGHDLTTAQREEGDIPVISSSGFSGYHNVAKAKGPGVVTGRYGTTGKMYYIEHDYWPMNTALYVYDFKGNHPRYIYYLLQILPFDAYSGKSAVPGIDRNDLHPLSVCQPPHHEQEQIAAYIDQKLKKLADLAGKVETAIERLHKYRAALISSAVTGKIQVKDER